MVVHSGDGRKYAGVTVTPGSGTDESEDESAESGMVADREGEMSSTEMRSSGKPEDVVGTPAEMFVANSDDGTWADV